MGNQHSQQDISSSSVNVNSRLGDDVGESFQNNYVDLEASKQSAFPTTCLYKSWLIFFGSTLLLFERRRGTRIGRLPVVDPACRVVAALGYSQVLLKLCA